MLFRSEDVAEDDDEGNKVLKKDEDHGKKSKKGVTKARSVRKTNSRVGVENIGMSRVFPGCELLA